MQNLEKVWKNQEKALTNLEKVLKYQEKVLKNLEKVWKYQEKVWKIRKKSRKSFEKYFKKWKKFGKIRKNQFRGNCPGPTFIASAGHALAPAERGAQPLPRWRLRRPRRGSVRREP